jgi:hypothetical protein
MWLEEDHPGEKPSACDVGFFIVADYGCTIEALLVISGARAGEIWKRDFNDGAGYFPIGEEAGSHGDIRLPNPCGFWAWYENWLDNACREVERGHPPGGKSQKSEE